MLYLLGAEALEIVYEFHRGHPRMTLGACEFLLRRFDLDSDTVPVRISPQQVTRAVWGIEMNSRCGQRVRAN